MREASSGLRAFQENDVRGPIAQRGQSREMEGRGCADRRQEGDFQKVSLRLGMVWTQGAGE